MYSGSGIATMLGVAPSDVRRWIDQGMPHMRIGNGLSIPIGDAVEQLKADEASERSNGSRSLRLL